LNDDRRDAGMKISAIPHSHFMHWARLLFPRQFESSQAFRVIAEIWTG
jgi:hypothetical protein